MRDQWQIAIARVGIFTLTILAPVLSVRWCFFNADYDHVI